MLRFQSFVLAVSCDPPFIIHRFAVGDDDQEGLTKRYALLLNNGAFCRVGRAPGAAAFGVPVWQGRREHGAGRFAPTKCRFFDRSLINLIAPL
jgi:hypothetical protein